MSQQRQFQMVGGNNVAGLQLGDTTYTKIFVGGLAWETQRETMRRYFEQFGEIQEAVVITDKNTGRSKGYGFVTFKDPDAAIRACQDPSPVIDGRRANCNLASLGAQHRTRPPTPKHGRFRAGASGGIGSSSTTYFHQHQYAFPPSAYGYSGYSQESMYPMNYYSAYGGGGGQQFSPYFTTAAASAPQGIYPSLYPLYAQYPQSSQTQGYGVQHPQMAVQYPYLPHHCNSTGIISLPTAVAVTVAVASPQPSNSAGVGGGIGSVGSQTGGATSTTTTTEQSSS